MAQYGFSRSEARAFLEAELGQKEGTTSFYWESEETEEVLELVVDAVSRLIEANNAKVTRDISDRALSDMRVPPGFGAGL